MRPGTMCLTDEEVGGFVTGTLTAWRRREVEEHCDGCSDCLHLLGEFGRAFASVTDIAESPETSPAPLDESTTLRGLSVLLHARLHGQCFGPYRVVQLVGWGASGVVYEAWDQRLRRPVALKLLTCTGAAARFARREAQAIARVVHPNVVNVYDVLEHGGRTIIVMELVAGATLRQWQVEASREQVLAMYCGAAEGLAALHERGLVHRDVKPDNVLVGRDGRPRIADFGLVAGSADATTAVVGTPAYMSPEQRHGGLVDARSDQYSFCVALLEALSRSLDPRALDELPRALAVPLRRGLLPDPAERWPSMHELLRALPRGRRAPRRVFMLGATVAGTAAAAWPSNAERPRCGSIEADAVWSQPRREALQNHLESLDPHAADTATRVVLALDEWFEAWRRERVAACEQLEDDDDTRGAAVIACSSRRLRTASVWLDALATTDAQGLARALEGTLELSAAAPCTRAPETVALPPAIEDGLARAGAARRLGDYARARALAQELLADVPHDPTAAAALHFELALAAVGTGRRDEAAAAFAEAFWHAAAVGDADTMVTAATSVSDYLAITENELALAERWSRHAQAIGAALEDPEHRAMLLENAATLAMTRGADTRAIDLLRSVLAIMEGLPRRELAKAQIELRLVAALARSGAIEEASAVARQAAEALRASLGAHHPRVHDALVTAGAVALMAGEDALPLLREALGERERRLGSDHPQTLMVVEMIAEGHQQRGQLHEAIAWFKRALTGLRRVGASSEELATAANNLGVAYYELGRLEQAQPLLEEAFFLMSELYGHDHPDVAALAANVAEVESRLGNTERAEVLCTEALSTLQAKLEPNDPRLVIPLTTCGNHARRVGRLAAARELLRRARALAAKHPAAVGLAAATEATASLAAVEAALREG